MENNKSARGYGAVGKKALVPRYIKENITKRYSLLDYGAGHLALHTQELRHLGYKVTAYDHGENVIDGVHDPNALEKKYDIVFASNVLNVQDTLQDVRNVLDEMKQCATKQIIFNLPLEPRYRAWTLKGDFSPLDQKKQNLETLFQIIDPMFTYYQVAVGYGTKYAPVVVVRN